MQFSEKAKHKGTSYHIIETIWLTIKKTQDLFNKEG